MSGEPGHGVHGGHGPDWDRLEALYEEALAREPSERAAFLDAMAGEDAALRAELASLLAHADAAPPFFERFAAVASDAVRTSDRELPDEAGEPGHPRDIAHGADVGGRFRIESELGHGGMGIVYRAFDTRLRRTVALKFLPPPLQANRRATAQFLAEARAAAALDHPNVCTLHEVGETEQGRLYLAMPCYDGETLKEKLAGGRLSPAAVLDYAIQIARGLAAAHEAGLVHRDVKPGNVMITSGGVAKLLDFGLARGPDEAGNRPGLVPGTTAYMSPEQIEGRDVDRRSDLWSLGVVLYEMVTGTHPFRAAGDVDTIRAVLHGRVVPVQHLHPDVPDDVAHVVMRLLERDPARRFGSAGDVIAALEQSAAHLKLAGVESVRRTRTRFALAAGLATSVALLALLASRARVSTDAVAERAAAAERVAILPFRTAGADPQLTWLREGMIDGLAAKLTGEVGPRAVDPGALMAAWQGVAGSAEAELAESSALAIARDAGAGTAVIGSVVGSPTFMTINASVVRLDEDRRSSVNVSGPVDSLPALLDQLAGLVLAVELGTESGELGPLRDIPFPALQHLLLGEAAYRRGDHPSALERFRRALEIDSTIAAAAFGIERAAPWTGAPEEVRERARRIAWQHRDRMSPLDRVHFASRAGPNYPEHPSVRELLEARERAVTLMPDRAEVWYELGDLYFHWGRILDEEDPFARALEYFRTALRLAPDFAPALQHSLMIAVATGDHAEVARLRGQVEGGSEMASFADWHIAAARGDSAALRRIRSSIADLSAYTLYIIPAASMGYGLPLDEAHLAVADLLTRNTTPGEREVRLLMARVTALSAGRPQVAARALKAYAAINPTHADRLTVLDALYAGGDSSSAAAAAKRLTASSPNADDELENRCVAAQWHLWHGQPLVDGDTTLPAQVRAAAGRGHGLRPSMLMTCAGVIEALAATTDIERDAALDRLEAFLQQGPFTGIANIDQPFDAVIPLARLRERAGDAAGALAAVRRGPFFHGNPAYPAEVALMEARLSARLLQPERAIAAYRRYLNMRPAPEPVLRAQVDSARAELSVLLDGRG